MPLALYLGPQPLCPPPSPPMTCYPPTRSNTQPYRVLGAFLAWSVGLQALCASRQVILRRRLDHARLAVDSLLLTTNNTGILGPVVLEAALGPKYAPLGMLATVSGRVSVGGSFWGALLPPCVSLLV